MSTSKLELSARSRSVELRIRNAGLQTVARGFGTLRAELPPGIYQMECRAGAHFMQELIALRPGQTVVRSDLDLPFESPVPLIGTSTSHEYHRWAVQQLSQKLLGAGTGDSGLLIFLRDLSAGSPPPPDAALVREWSILDGSFQPVPADAGTGFIADAATRSLGLARRLPAGGYVLRYRRGPRFIDQAIWLSAGWTTALFIPIGRDGPAPEQASVQMARLHDGFPGDMEEVHEIGRAAELALAGLRDGRAVLSADDLTRLLNGKFQNPMLGIIGAHALLLRRASRPDLLAVVLRNLEQLVPGHPDVAALRRAAQKLGWLDRSESGPPVSSPPMLFASFRALLDSDVRDDDALANGSLAEAVSPFLLQLGTWTTWNATRATAAESRPDEKPASAGPILPATLESTVSEFLTGKLDLAKALDTVSSRLSLPTQARQLPDFASEAVNVAVARVSRYLREVVEFSESKDLPGLLAVLPYAQIARDTGLPPAHVKLAAEKIRAGLVGVIKAVREHDRLRGP